jgi:manganese/zinc/iron transport system permease protein
MALAAVSLLLLAGCANADSNPDSFAGRTVRFFSLTDPFLRSAILGSVLLALNCALLGTFLVVRRMSLASDTLAHAVLPGIVGGYLWNMTKDPTALLVGAIVAGLIGTMVMNAILQTTKLKADAAQGIVLSLFLALGVCLIQMLPPGNKAGLDKFLFGQLAAVDGRDLVLLGIATAVNVASILVLFRGFLVLSFDEGFGRCVGMPMRLLHAWFMFLTTVTIVVSMEAVGVVLISALMIIPASAAALLTVRIRRMLLLAGIAGVLAALLGSYWSFVVDRIPAGPSVVLVAAFLFALAFFFSPRDGWLARHWIRWRWQARVGLENQLKTVYRWMEDGQRLAERTHSMEDFARDTGKTTRQAKGEQRRLQAGGFSMVEGGAFSLTDAGLQTARRLVRSHRLWELYLTRRASFAPDHVHEDAENMEHLLSEENLLSMEELLGWPATDPHGRPIPREANSTPHSNATP